MRLLLKLSILLLLIALISNIIIGFYFYDLSVARTSKDFLAENVTLKKTDTITAETMVFSNTDNDIDWFNSQPYEEVSIASEDNLLLKGYYLAAAVPTANTAILAHGYTSQGTFMGPYAKLYSEGLGYNVLLPDSRAHGKSEGNAIGFGWIDRLDYLKWIDFILDKVGEESKIVMHGVSMGGATVSMASGENLPRNVKAVISDSAYTSVKDELEYQLKIMFNLPYFPFMSSTSILTKIRAGFSFEEASALRQVKNSSTPTLFIHGEADAFVPFYMVNELYEACSSDKDIFVVPNAGHGEAYNTDPIGYANKISEFIGKYVN